MQLYQENRLQIRSKAIIGYTYTEYPSPNSKAARLRRQISNQNLQKERYTGKLTAGAKKRMTRSIELLCQSVKPKWIEDNITGKRHQHKLSFITLTVSTNKNLTARECYDKAFKHFIQWLRRTMQVKTYIWKVEFQKRGQIHYHITSTSYIPWQKIKEKWNYLQQCNGWLDEYYKVHKHYQPNSTDIHSVKSVKNLSGYLCKEFTKSIQNPETTGKVWDCSENLKAYGYYTVQETNENNRLISEIIDKEPKRVKILDRCFIINTNRLSIERYLTLHQINKFDNHISQIKSYCSKPPAEPASTHFSARKLSKEAVM